MTTLEHPAKGAVAAPRNARKGSIMADWLSSTDHKVIGHLYLITSFAFFGVGGIMARGSPRGKPQIFGDREAIHHGGHLGLDADAEANDRSFKSWTCARGLACQVMSEVSQMGMCFVGNR